MIKRENDTVKGGKSWRRKNEDNRAKIKQKGENSGKSDEKNKKTMITGF